MRFLRSHRCCALVACTVALLTFSPQIAEGQGTGSRGVELDRGPNDGRPPAPPAPPPATTTTTKPPATTTTLAEVSVEAQRLFDERRWADAAPLLYQVYKAPGPTTASLDLAQYQLGITLFRLKLYFMSFSVFGAIADMPLHTKHEETLAWLERLARVLPEAADVMEVIGRYDEAAIDRYGGALGRDAPPDAAAHLNYLLGRYKYRNRLYQDALRLFAKVPPGSAYFTKAQFLSGIAHVQLRQPVPAVRSFGRIVHEIDARPSAEPTPTPAPPSGASTTTSGEPSDATQGVSPTNTNANTNTNALVEPGRMRDLAYLSAARTYYSASVHASSDGYIAIDDVKLKVALKYWDRVEATGEYGLDALFEQAWAYTMLGDYARALGNIHTLDAPFFPHAYYPEAEILKAGIYLVTCHLDDAETLVARFKQKYQPMRTDLAQLVKRLDGEDKTGGGNTSGSDEAAYAFLKDVRDGKSTLPWAIRSTVEQTLTDREVLRHLQYLVWIDGELRKLASMKNNVEEQQRMAIAIEPASLRLSTTTVATRLKTTTTKTTTTSSLRALLMDFGRERLELSRDLGIRRLSQLARDRAQQKLSELEGHLRTSTWMLVEIAEERRGRSLLSSGPAGRGGILGEPARGRATPTHDTVRADDEHVIWPFTGEYWRDEIGLYQQSITSKCR